MNLPNTIRPDLESFFASLDSCEDKRSSTHGLHPYPAKFIPHIPRALIDAFSGPGDIVLDPMCGSGTTVVEAILAGRNGLGGDINPISTLVSRAKTTKLNSAGFDELNAWLQDPWWNAPLAPEEIQVPEFHNRDRWFSEEVSMTLATCLKRIETLMEPSARLLARSAFSSIVVAVSNQDSETRWVRTERSFTSSQVMQRFRRKVYEHLDKSVALTNSTTASGLIWNGDARHLPLSNSSVQLVVTSPPYANSHDYYLYNKLRLFWLGYPVRPVQDAEFGSRNKHSDYKLPVEHYLTAMEGVLSECRRVVRDGGHTCIVVGDAVIRGEVFDMGERITRVAAKSGLRREHHFRFSQKRYTRAFTRGFGTRVEKATHVLVFK